jgi:predicted TIM-barrel fold metal-dependent hydrolase
MTQRRIIDVDSHLSEPHDLWTRRLPAKWHDVAPRVVHDARHGMDRWVVGDRALTGVAGFASAGWHQYPPGCPPTRALADEAAFDSTARLAWLDTNGIYAQALYPNLLAFMVFAFRKVPDQRFALDCIRAYNDFLIEFSEAAPDRFIALCALPFWDLDESVGELERAHAMGHRGVLFIGKPHKLGLPPLADPHWAPLFKQAEERQLSLNFHTGFNDVTEDEFVGALGRGVTRASYARQTSLNQLLLAETVADLTTTDVCLNYPDLQMVIVESGVGWLRFFLELLDWQWMNSGAHAERPDREVPSFYFSRQVHASFWFERESMARIVDLYQDNVMFETDFPHPTSLSPGPTSTSGTPGEMAEIALGHVDPDVADKVLYRNAARLYHVEGPRRNIGT